MHVLLNYSRLTRGGLESPDSPVGCVFCSRGQTEAGQLLLQTSTTELIEKPREDCSKEDIQSSPLMSQLIFTKNYKKLEPGGTLVTIG